MTVQSAFHQFLSAWDPATKGGQVFQTLSAKFVITGAADNGSGLIRITAAGHGLLDGHYTTIGLVLGCIEANSTTSNPAWQITWVDSSHFDLIGSTFTNAFTASPNAYGVGALVGSVHGDKLTRELQLSAYNQARIALLEGARALYTNSPGEITALLGGHSIVSTLKFTHDAGPPVTATATRPVGLVKFEGMASSDGSVTVVLRSQNDLVKVLRGDSHYAQSASVLYIFDEATKYVHHGAFMNADPTYTFIYKGITDWTLADVMAGTAEETIRPAQIPILVQLAIAVAKGAGGAQAATLAAHLLGGK